MKRTTLAALALLCVASTDATCPESVRAQDFSSEELARRTIERRAVEAVNLGHAGGQFRPDVPGDDRRPRANANQIVYWSRLPDWKNQTLTPNPDVIYLMPFFNTKDVGPMVLEIPPAEAMAPSPAASMDAWQTALEDVGPAGVGQGQGRQVSDPAAWLQGQDARRLHRAAIDDLSQAMPCCARTSRAAATPTSPRRSPTASGSSSIRSRRPATRRRRPSSMRSTSSTTAPFPYDLRFFQSLDRIVQSEPWLERDKVMIDMLKSIGIEKGKPFNPDAQDDRRS